MGGPARVKSIDALQTMSAAMECFRADATTAVDDLDMEIRRALQWIGQDCRQYWNHELRLARDGVTEARLQLQHAMTYRRMSGEHSSCIEEKKALQKAQRRLQVAEGKVEAIPHWVVTIERVVNEYRASRSQFANWLDSDFPRAVAVLSRMISALETYVRLGAAAGENTRVSWPDNESKDDTKNAAINEEQNAQMPQISDPNT
jgi:hypothetical protein